MPSLLSRQVDPDRLPDGWVIDSDGVARPWWYSRTGYIVKWAVFFGLVTFIGLYLVLGYLHAKRRLRKGQVPLAYHRFLISKRELSRVDPRYAYPQSTYTNYNSDYYNTSMNMHPMPPPPVYEPPQGATKTDPSQWRTDPTRRPVDSDPAPVYEAPPGPPPMGHNYAAQGQYQYQNQPGLAPQDEGVGSGGAGGSPYKNLAGKALGFLKGGK